VIEEFDDVILEQLRIEFQNELGWLTFKSFIPALEFLEVIRYLDPNLPGFELGRMAFPKDEGRRSEDETKSQ
jgi:hypothetical protein